MATVTAYCEGQPDYLEANTPNGAKSHKLCTDEPIIDGYLPAMCDFIDFQNLTGQFLHVCVSKYKYCITLLPFIISSICMRIKCSPDGTIYHALLEGIHPCES